MRRAWRGTATAARSTATSRSTSSRRGSSRRDGHARQIGDYITIYPVVTGEFDLDRGWNPEKNGVRIIARLLNELEIDITKWSFEDVTPGKQSFKVNTVSTLGDEITVEIAIDPEKASQYAEGTMSMTATAQ